MTGRLLVALGGVCMAIFLPEAQAAHLLVSAQYPTIQNAIDSAPAGATVVVAPGTYRENLVIEKALTITSARGADVTVLDGGAINTVVWIRGSGSEKVTVSGFRITNGLNLFTNANSPTPGSGGGIRVESVNATIADNVITSNVSCLGTGISVTTATVNIRRNQINDNVQHASCFGANGGGIFINGAGVGPSRISENTVSGHRIGGYGGGIAVNAIDNITIASNVINNNHAADYGGGLFVNGSSAEIANNVLSGNVASVEGGAGGGVALLLTEPSNRVVMRENALLGNTASTGSAALLLTYYADALRFMRNVAIGRSPSALVSCDGQPFVVARNNLLTNPGGPEIGGTCLLGVQ